jgi:hypothetical protein
MVNVSYAGGVQWMEDDGIVFRPYSSSVQVQEKSLLGY